MPDEHDDTPADEPVTLEVHDVHIGTGAVTTEED